jgi:predicted MPP superfamily phosphohydrolase
MRFVIVGDLHYSLFVSRRLSQQRNEFYTRLFEKIASVNPQAVFLIGDVSHTSRTEELEGLREVAYHAGVKHYYMVNGNHDLLRLKPEQIARHNYNPRPGYFALALNEQGQPEASSARSQQFVTLNTGQWAKAFDPAGVVDPTQLGWLAEQIEQSQTTKPLFVLGHHPLYNLTEWAWLPGMHLRNSQEVWQLLSRKQAGPGFYFCGHNHTNSYVQRGNWLLVQTAAPLATLSFRLVELTEENRVALRLVELVDPQKPRERARLAGLAGLISATQANVTNLLSRSPRGEKLSASSKALEISW